ncbi:hypothetical protein HBR94_26820 [Pseudomonas sp. WS 5412]|uniref:hypothetical protein n=1 Tax=Pseudomonas sp. WS 5412 TaxID=2717487 RepID=UPI0014747F3C|nr:hypothetical protein [Pseudomonas sp. WS 5412]NMY35115.1 hypothetical protein [Pseudomonas sp. WS 5412]
MSFNGRAVVIKNSPVEFVVSGPLEGRDRIIIRSENAGLDLIGKAIQSGGKQRRRGWASSFFTLFNRDQYLNTVVGGFVPDVRPEIDDRYSMLAFTWRGYATSSGVRRVEGEFRQFYRDIHFAYLRRDEDDVEIQISPLIYQCSLEDKRATDSRRLARYLLGAYAVLGMAMVAWYVVRFF